MNNNLIVNKCWDIKMANDFLIEINGEYYLIKWNCGKVNSNSMRKVASQEWAKQRAKHADEIVEYMYPLMGLEKKDGYDVEIGRAITEQEFAELKERLDLSEDKISEPFTNSVGSIFGEKWKKTFSAVQIVVPVSKSLAIEEELKKNGIESFCGSPGRVSVRIK